MFFMKPKINYHIQATIIIIINILLHCYDYRHIKIQVAVEPGAQELFVLHVHDPGEQDLHGLHAQFVLFYLRLLFSCWYLVGC